MKKKIFLSYFIIFSLIAAVAAAGGYTAWNKLDPQYTCAQCHEVKPTHERWAKSAHAEISCTECHGTAISNGMHSLKEKVGMVVSHFSKNVRNADIKMNEAQRLDVSARCVNCHRAEAAGWKSGGHSTTYANIFEDKIHNAAEKPYWECLRCHGMFYDGNINDLMSLDGKPEDWKIRNPEQRALPAVPCLACHQIHAEKTRPKNFADAYKTPLQSKSAPKAALYMRVDKLHLRADCLTPLKMYLDEKPIANSQDPNHALCQQCHSPNWRHEAGSSDDRTPVGAHAGMSCLACHNSHSGEAASSCAKCHDTSDKKFAPQKGKCPQFINSKKN